MKVTQDQVTLLNNVDAKVTFKKLRKNLDVNIMEGSLRDQRQSKAN